jgi:hypothetical protein
LILSIIIPLEIFLFFVNFILFLCQIDTFQFILYDLFSFFVTKNSSHHLKIFIFGHDF